MEIGLATAKSKILWRFNSMKENKEIRSSAHSKYRCQYHIVFATNIGEKKSPHISIAQFMGYLKGKSSLMIFDRHANLKYKYGSRHFWCRGYYVDTVGRNKKIIAEYIRDQLDKDHALDQATLEEYMDPFMGKQPK